jgi:hypothetical protein
MPHPWAGPMGSSPQAPFLRASSPRAFATDRAGRSALHPNPSERPWNAPVLWDSPPLVHSALPRAEIYGFLRATRARAANWNPYGWAHAGS